MTKWEYSTVSVGQYTNTIINDLSNSGDVDINKRNTTIYQILQAFGQKGWELVCVDVRSINPLLRTFCFKRPVA